MISTHQKLIINSVIDFMKSEFNINAKLTVKRKSKSGLLGDVTMSHNSVNLNKFTLHYNPSQGYTMIIQSLIHELTHVKQISNKELQPSSDYKSIIWKGSPYITVKELNKSMKSINDYMNLPWEKEAYGNMKKLYPKFIKSKYFKNLRGKNATLDYILDNEVTFQ